MRSSIAHCLLFLAISVAGWAQRPKNIDYSKADSIAELYPAHPLTDLRALSLNLTRPFDNDAEKFRAIFKWVCTNIHNDYELYQINQSKDAELSGTELVAWNKAFHARVIRKLIREHATVCTGYAYVLTELALYAGLMCETIHGYGRNTVSNIGGKGVANHSWNAVQLDGRWYLCDATWASGAIDPQRRTFIQQYNDAYFLTEPSLFIRNHYPLETRWMLTDDSPSLDAFLNGPLIYAGAIRQGVIAVDPNRLEVRIRKGDTYQFAIDTGSRLSANPSLIVDEHAVYHSVTQQKIDSTYRYNLGYTFRRKGTYAAHLVVQGEYLCSYRVIVE